MRIYAGLYPEYEVVLDPQVSTHKIFRYGPVRSIYGKAYDGWNAANPHRTLATYISRAEKIPVKKQEFELSESMFNDLVERQKAIDFKTCGREPFLHSKGEEIVVLDRSTYEVTTDSGRKRAAVLNTFGDGIVSPNPNLLQWATDVRKLANPAN